MRKNKYKQGKIIWSIDDLLYLIESGVWLYWIDKPKHPAVFKNFSLGTIMSGLRSGIIKVANPND